MREIYINQWDYFDQIYFMYLMREISRTLVSSSTRWRNKLDEIQKVCLCIGTLLIERKDLKFKELIDEVLAGNMKQLELQKKLPKNASQFTTEQKATAYQQLQFLNRNSKEMEQFLRRPVKDAFKPTQFQKKLEEHLGFSLLPQTLCINYLMQCQSSRAFVNFGMGNGKTLMCICIATHLAQSTQTPVFIVGKNDHLVLRDEKTYQSTITGMGIRVNVGEWDSKVGIYFLTQKDVEQFSEDMNFINTWQRGSVVMDEHDWIMFDGSVNQMKSVIQLLQPCHKLVAFTGSVLNQKEATILNDVFGVREVTFPSISSVTSQRRTHLTDILVPSTLQDYTRQLISILEAQTFKTPVVIVCQQSFPQTESILKKQSHLKVMIVKNLRGGKVEASLEGTLCLKNQCGRYGVFVLSEQQGRGTDLKSSQEIEANGGLYLIVADVFTKRSHEQILGRVARLENKGSGTI
ncbi:Protein translocase subunit secA [Oxytricha trifallax]|uniref:Protein translocase subunit secA n=1 Tax=Oxytricha trifallax TaxID=1172189 RepID=A0A073HZE1_9SPIT|nr:Protein translocase subunit secA [Oxytricha trifallax]